jgi:hypothetical protein
MATVTPALLMRRENRQKIQLLALTTDLGAVISNAVVTATMNDQSGTPLPEINAAVLPSIDSNGNYSYEIPATFNPPIGNYVCVITASVAGVPTLKINQPITVADRTS